MSSRSLAALIIAASGILVWAQEGPQSFRGGRPMGPRRTSSNGQQGTVLHWRFVGEPGKAPTADEALEPVTGKGFARVIGGPIYHAVEGVIGLEFSAGDDRVFIKDDPALAITGSLTLEAVIRCDGVAPDSRFQNQIVFRGDDRPGLDPYFLAVSLDGRLMFHVQNERNQFTEILSPGPLPTGRLLHIAGTLDERTNAMELHINGRRIASSVTNIRPMGPLDASSLPGVSIGNVQSATYPEGFNGLIAEVRISNRALSPDEFLRPPIAAAVRARQTRQPRPTPPMAEKWGR